MPDTCFFCDRREIQPQAWSLDSLRFIFEGWTEKKVPMLCENHEAWIKARIEELKKEQPKKVVLRTGEKYKPSPVVERFLPKPIAEPVSRYEREPGEDG